VEDLGEVAGAGLRLGGETNGDPEAHRMPERLQPCSVRARVHRLHCIVFF
jgi:hypothetical protein